MKGLIKWRKEEGFGKMDFNVFKRELAKKVKKIEEGSVRNDSIWLVVSDSEHEHFIHRHKQGNSKQCISYNTPQTKMFSPTLRIPLANTSYQQSLGKRKRENENERLPPCLIVECRRKGGRHFIQPYGMLDEATKLKLRDEYRAAKKA